MKVCYEMACQIIVHPLNSSRSNDAKTTQYHLKNRTRLKPSPTYSMKQLKLQAQ